MGADQLQTALEDKNFNDGNTRISFRYLKKMNLIAGCLHTFQFCAMLGAAFGVENIANFRIPFQLTYIAFNNATFSLETRIEPLGETNPGIVVPFFLGLSGFFHFLVITCGWNTYIVDLDKGINRFRWYEYSISSSLMIFVIAQFFGVYDLATLLLICGVNAAMNWFGFTMEVINQYTDEVQWESFIFGCITGILPWVVIMMYFLGGPESPVEPPAFVYGIIFSYFFFFNTFPVNMVLQYAKCGRWADYRYGELWYIILSLVSKTLLAWLVLGGTAQPN